MSCMVDTDFNMALLAELKPSEEEGSFLPLLGFLTDVGVSNTLSSVVSSGSTLIVSKIIRCIYQFKFKLTNYINKIAIPIWMSASGVVGRIHGISIPQSRKSPTFIVNAICI